MDPPPAVVALPIWKGEAMEIASHPRPVLVRLFLWLCMIFLFCRGIDSESKFASAAVPAWESGFSFVLKPRLKYCHILSTKSVLKDILLPHWFLMCPQSQLLSALPVPSVSSGLSSQPWHAAFLRCSLPCLLHFLLNTQLLSQPPPRHTAL